MPVDSKGSAHALPPEPWRSFLHDFDAQLKGAVALRCLGGQPLRALHPTHHHVVQSSSGVMQLQHAQPTRVFFMVTPEVLRGLLGHR